MKRNTRYHFDNLADRYHGEIPDHVRTHLINKWWGHVSGYLPPKTRVLDIGCGEGSNIDFMTRKGLDARGIDFSAKLVQQAHTRYPRLQERIAEGDALRPDFPDESFDVATLIGVLHHIYSREDQLQAIREALRVVRKGGVVIIRESNLINPLFRVYWNYIFPLTAKIDRFGGEHWISARYLQKQLPRQVTHTAYFTFIPSLVPQYLMSMATRIENLLEAGPLRKLSAHYILILRK